jgi:hypothetical protein
MIDRAWYLFFLSVFQSTLELQDLQKLPDTSAALASYDAALNALAQYVQTLAPQVDLTDEFAKAKDLAAAYPSSAVAELTQQIDALRQEVQTLTPTGLAELAQQLDGLRQEVQTAIRPELGTLSQLQQANVPWLTFDTTPETVPTVPGTVYWTDDDATLNLVLEGNTEYQFGQQLDFHPKNTSGVQINKGMAVMATGVVGSSTKITCARAVADGSVLPQYMLGIATQDIPNNSFGYVAWFGSVRGFNTTGANKTVPEVWVDGDVLYFDPVYPGELTKVEPSAPDLDLPIAIITNAASNGAIFVRMKTGESLNELHDVNITLPLVNRDLLQYDSTAGYWKNITHFFLDATNKRMGINAPTPLATLVVNANASTAPPTPLSGTVVDIHGANATTARATINGYGAAPAVTFVRSGGTMAAPSAVAIGDILGFTVATGFDGSAYTAGRGSIQFFAEESWTTTANGTSIRFITTPVGSTSATERGRITASGAWSFGTTGTDYGTTGQVLTSQGNAPPVWQTPVTTPTLNVVTGTTQTAVANNHYVLTNVAISTLTLPATPTAGDVVWVTVGNGLTTNVVARNGSNIQSLAEDMTLNARYASVQMRYINSTIGWTFV